MTNWVCKQDAVPFTAGAPGCPECGTRDAYEQGGDRSLNVYDAVEVTGIGSPGAAWGAVNEAVAAAIHEHRLGDRVPELSHGEGVAAILSEAPDAGVAQRLGLVPGDPGARDSSTDPVPVEGALAEVDDTPPAKTETKGKTKT